MSPRLRTAMAGLRCASVVPAFRRRAALLCAALLPVLSACDSSTDPVAEPPVEMADNTLAITASGALEFEGVVEAIGGFQHVSTGEGTGIHISAEVGGLPFAIHLPGPPVVGEFPLGRWDALDDYVRGDTILWVGRKPSISFGDGPAVVLNHYASIEYGTIEIDDITIPEADDFFGTGNIRGRLHARAVADSLLVVPGTSFEPDTVDLSVEFNVAIENWPDGRAAADFVGGTFAGMSVPRLLGSGSVYLIGTDPEDLLVVGLGAGMSDRGEFRLWLGTKLTGAGSAALESIDPDSISWPGYWPDHFIAGTLDGRPIASLGGTIELDVYDRYTYERWGEAMGRVTVDLAIDGATDGARTEHVTAEIRFHVPVGFLIGWETGQATVRPAVGRYTLQAR